MTIVLFTNAFIYKPLFKMSLVCNYFMLRTNVSRDKYIYRRMLLCPSWLILFRKKCYVDWNCVEMMHVSVSLFEWLTFCGGAGNACAAKRFLVFCKMETWISANYQVQISFCLTSEEQISVFNHFSLTFSLQYSVASICSRFDRCFL